MDSRQLLSILIFASLGASALGQSSPPYVTVSGAPATPVQPSCSSGQPGTLSVAGRGQAEATADVAQVSLNIAVTNATAEGAKEVAATLANNVITAVRQVQGVYPDNVTTTSVSVYPKTVYNSNSSTSTIVGYTYTNYLSIGLSNLTGDLLSKVLDTAVRSGGNNLTISSTSFSLSPALSYNRTVDARSQATADARTTAQQYARGLGVTLGPVLSVTDVSSSSTPVQNYQTAASAAGAGDTRNNNVDTSTPVSIGKQRVYAAISVTFTICSANS